MRKGAFARLCVAMNQQLVPVLASAGSSSSDTPFRREQVRYEFRRWRAERDGGGCRALQSQT